MVVFADNDIILKLAAFDLLDKAALLLGVPSTDIRVLDTARHYFRKRKDKLALAYTEEGVARAVAFAESAVAVEQFAVQPEIEVLARIEHIDPGEAVLFAATGSVADFLLMSGDKRALRAIHNSPDLAAVRARLAGRVVCLEALIHGLIAAHGFETIRSCILPATVCDTAVRAAFGSGLESTAESVSETLLAYVADLETTVGPGWLWSIEYAAGSDRS